MKRLFTILIALLLVLSLCLTSCEDESETSLSSEQSEEKESSSDKESSSSDESSSGESSDGESSSSGESSSKDEVSSEPAQSVATVLFDTGGAGPAFSQVVNVGGKLKAPTVNLSKDGYEFDGWYVDGERWSFIGYVVTEDMTLVARWIPTSYNITYVGAQSSGRTSYTIEDTFALSEGQATDYTFEGWYLDEALTQPITKIEKGSKGDITLYAKKKFNAFHKIIFERRTDTTCVVTGAVEGMEYIEIPDTYNGMSVVEIRPEAFREYTSLKKIKIGNNVTVIENHCFYGCYQLEEIELGSGLKFLGAYSFEKCGIKEIKLPAGLELISSGAFYDCIYLKEITIPKSVMSVGTRVFADCASLENIYVEQGSTRYKSVDGVLYSLEGTILVEYPRGSKREIFVVPDTVKTIAQQAFEESLGLKGVLIGEGVTSIGSNAFYECASLIIYCASDTAPAGIPSSLVSKCVFNVKNVGKTIEGMSWAQSTSDEIYISGYTGALENLTIPSTINNLPVTSIAPSAFYGNTIIKSITIPTSIKSIGDGAFSACVALESIIVQEGGSPCAISIDGVLYSADGTRLIAYPCGSTRQTFIVPEGVKTIAQNAFVSVENLQILLLPSTIAGISSNSFDTEPSFSICVARESVSAPSYVTKNVKDIGITTEGLKWAQDVANNIVILGTLGQMESITIPATIGSASVTAIGCRAFYKNTHLKTISLPDGMLQIGESAFEGCSMLKDVNLPSTLTRLDGNAFRDCVALKTASLPSALTIVGRSAFYNCIALESVTASNGITDIGSSAFYGCSSLTSITLPSTIETIGDTAFNRCPFLKKVIFNGNATDWCEIVFFGATANPLSNGADLYFGNTLVTSISLTSTTVKLGAYLFYGCTSLMTITLPDDCEMDIHGNAFAGCDAEVRFADGSKMVARLTYKISINSACSNPSHDHGVRAYKAGDTVTVSSVCCGTVASGNTFFGWYSNDGTVYAPGETFVINEDTTLYVAIGRVVTDASDLDSFLKNGSGVKYARLGNSITVSGTQLYSSQSGWAHAVIDLNGYTLTSQNVQYGFGCQRTGMVFVGEGTVNFTSSDTSGGAFFMTSYHGYGDGNQALWIGKNVTVNSNVVLAKTTNMMSRIDIPSIKIYGTINAPALVQTAGGDLIPVDIYESARINIIAGSAFPIIYDSSANYLNEVVTIHGGVFTLPDNFVDFIDLDEKRIKIVIKGGTFNKNISNYVPEGYYTIINPNGTYTITKK